jgi:nucleoid-associated protein YgaU
MADNTNMQYDRSGQWREIYGPDVDQARNPVTPQTSPDVEDPPARGSDSGGEAARKYRERQFNLEGNATVMPSPHIEARTVVEFLGLGNQFSGRYFLKTVRHTWSKDGGYTQELEVRRNGFGGFSTPTPTAADSNLLRPAREKVEPVSDAVYYTVKEGDTLWTIANRFYSDGSQYQKIALANSIENPNEIRPGQTLLIP